MLTPPLIGILHLPPTSVPCLYPRESRLPPGFPLNGTWFPQAIHYRSLLTSSRQRNQSAVRATLLITYLEALPHPQARVSLSPALRQPRAPAHPQGHLPLKSVPPHTSPEIVPTRQSPVRAHEAPFQSRCHQRHVADGQQCAFG